jgi:hypothetical protein
MGSRRFPCQLPRIGSSDGRLLGSKRKSIFRKTEDGAQGVSIVCCWLLTNGYSYKIQSVLPIHVCYCVRFDVHQRCPTFTIKINTKSNFAYIVL